ncbi:MAG: hypothetical protein AAF391_02790 [Bacteroidota bacterium]
MEKKENSTKSTKEKEQAKEPSTDKEEKEGFPEGVDFKKFLGCGG